MPGGIPVGTMAVGKSGAVNAAIFAVQMLSLSDKSLEDKLNQYKEDLKKSVIEGDAKIQSDLSE